MMLRLLLALMFFILCTVTCNASWLVYHKPEFKGKVVDLDTDMPIEGVIVVALYKKRTLNPPVEAYVSIFHVQEALTDKNGNFSIPSYTTFINPFSSTDDVYFIIYKPGYAWERPVPIEDTFTGKDASDFVIPMSWNKSLKCILLKTGVVKLPKVITDKDRINSFDSTGQIDTFRKQLPVSIKIIDQERKYVIDLDKKWRNEK